MSEPTLLPCPFCGGTNILGMRHEFGGFYEWCDSCKCGGPSIQRIRGDPSGEQSELAARARATEAWNARPAPTCATCLHWDRMSGTDALPARDAEGRCWQIHMKLEIGIRTGTNGGYVSSIESWGDFGCNLHEPRAGADDE